MSDMAKVIKIKDATWERLRNHGWFGDSHDDLIQRVLDKAEGKPANWIEK